MSVPPFSLSSRLSACLWAVVAAPAPLAAQPDDRLAEPIVTVKTVSDEALIGRLIEFSLDGGLIIAADDRDRPLRYCTEDVVRVVADRRSRPAATDVARLELTGGDLLYGRVVAFADDVVQFETESMGRIPVPLDRIARWTRQSSGASPQPATPGRGEPLRKTAGDHAEAEDDVLILNNGDVIRGLVLALDERGFVIENDLGESRLGHQAVASAVMVPIVPAPTEGTRVRILTTDGQRLTAQALTWSDGWVTGTVLDRTAIQIPADRVARLDVVGGRWQWLTALQPISYEHTPALSLAWEWQLDRNVIGGPLRVASRTYAHGLGVHSQCAVTFDLEGAYGQFVTSMGLDDDTGPYADVDVEIRVDGQRRFAKQGLTPGTLHGPIRLDVAGAKRIQLIVKFGKNADLQDRFNWIEAALIR